MNIMPHGLSYIFQKGYALAHIIDCIIIFEIINFEAWHDLAIFPSSFPHFKLSLVYPILS